MVKVKKLVKVKKVYTGNGMSGFGIRYPRLKKLIELVTLILGSIILTVLVSSVLSVSIYAIGFVIFILAVIVGTGIWRWKQGDKFVPDASVNSEVDNISVMTDDLKDNKKYVCVGSVYGESIITIHMVNDLWASLKTLFGGEPVQYHGVMSIARKVAVNRMKMDAHKKGAILISSHRLATTQIVTRAAEVMAYGTAWKLKSNSLLDDKEVMTSLLLPRRKVYR